MYEKIIRNSFTQARGRASDLASRELSRALSYRFGGKTNLLSKDNKYRHEDMFSGLSMVFGGNSENHFDKHQARDYLLRLLRSDFRDNSQLRIEQRSGGPKNVTSDVSFVLSSALKAGVNISLDSMRKNAAHSHFATYSGDGSFKGTEYPTLFVHASNDSEFGEYHELAPGADAPILTLGDYNKTIFAKRYGSAYAVTRQAFLNDDQGVLQALHMNAAGAMEAESSLVMDAITNGTVGGGSIYQTELGTLLENAVLNAETVEKMMQSLQDLKLGGSYTPMHLKYLLVPTSKKAAAMEVLARMFGKYDDYEGDIKVLSDPRLKGNAFYGIPKEAGTDTPFVVVSFVDGMGGDNGGKPMLNLNMKQVSTANDAVAFTSSVYLGVDVTNPICIKADGVE